MLKSTRMTYSRELLREAAAFCLGSYTEQEAKKGDEWREVELPKLYDHLRHEVVEEIRGNIGRNELDYLIHNAADAATLSLMMLARALEAQRLAKEQNGGS